MIDALVFLPLHDVSRGMHYLKSIATSEALGVLNYFDTTYVSGGLRPARRQPRLRRLAPTFPPVSWNVHDASLSGSARTNNVCESWNNTYRNLVGHAHPCVWTSIDAIRKDQAAVCTTVYQQRNGQPQRKRVRCERSRLQQQLQQLCKEYADGARDMQQFLRAVGHTIRFH